jgi:hypothetical protein
MNSERTDTTKHSPRGHSKVLAVAIADDAGHAQILSALTRVTEPPIAVVGAEGAHADELPEMVIIALGEDHETGPCKSRTSSAATGRGRP